jgi:2,3-bisphosphoglycerate-dependent phosphoglycerate mutase
MEEQGSQNVAGACRIHLFRHGQTVMNVENRFRGLLDIPLSETGRAEAWDAARSLIGSGVSVVYTSPLGRARQVAHAIAAATNLRTVHELPELVNLDYGRWEGLTREECADADPADWALYAKDPEQATCPDGESLAAAADRVLAALRTIGQAHPGETVAAVSHGVMLRLAVLRVAAPTDEDWQFALPTGAALTFEVDASQIALTSSLDRSVPKEGLVAAPLSKAG